ncbi:hypothetical protein [Halomonas sp. ML-15]|uniref:hypothetical protein n=1 Tax=Halomonas sp. ML-15 TaxID=2773305 RepID=UPI001CD0555F|nr:hypothetical protein [Halomonas sp. ML-15]
MVLGFGIYCVIGGYFAMVWTDTIGLALAFALTSDNVIDYITRMISTIMAGLLACALLGRFWPRYNWQGAVATLVSASSTSLVIIANADWNAYWGNPSIPAVLTALSVGVAVSLLTPAPRTTPQQALAILDEERRRMEQMPDAAMTAGQVNATGR